jgi:hypothetical protein
MIKTIDTLTAAAELDISVSQVRRLIKEKKLLANRDENGHYHVFQESVDRYEKERKRPGRPKKEDV